MAGHLLRRPRHDEPHREDRQADEERPGRSDPIAEPAVTTVENSMPMTKRENNQA